MSDLPQEHVTDPDDPLVAELAERQWHWRLRYRYPDAGSGRTAARDLVRELLGGSRLVRTAVGFVWLGPDGEHTPVLDVRAYEPGDPGSVAALREVATALAGSPLATSVLPGEPSREAFVADGSFRLTATTMRLDVTGAVPGEELADRAQVTPMTEQEVTDYRAAAVASYARSREEAGESAELARKTSEASFDALLPGGRPGEGQHLFTVRHAGERAGVLWVCRRWPTQAWVYDVEVDPAWRGHGLGAAAMVHAARWTRAAGLPWLGLNVFGPNAHARSLYERLGYAVEEEHLARPHSTETS
ncbi:GNAT family N-acetyltransferase [Nocardioides sp.]|uniref:GNAT family N-acetyltransferase n=1 Tax=Nocardioides sp. TaxID=35761 RepID=UPI002ED12E7F